MVAGTGGDVHGHGDLYAGDGDGDFDDDSACDEVVYDDSAGDVDGCDVYDDSAVEATTTSAAATTSMPLATTTR